MPHTWSLPVDMHLHIAGTLLLPWLRVRPVRVLLAALLVAMLPVFLLKLLQGGPPLIVLTPHFLANLRSSPEFFDWHMPTHLRAAPYVVGMASAVALSHLKVSHGLLFKRKQRSN